MYLSVEDVQSLPNVVHKVLGRIMDWVIAEIAEVVASYKQGYYLPIFLEIDLLK